MRKNVRRAQYSEYSFHHLWRIAFDFCRNLDCLSFEEIVLGHDATIVSVRAVSGRSTVPQVFIGGKHIGGSDDLEKYFA